MSGPIQPGDQKAVWLLSTLGGVIGGLCCLAPIVMVLFGLAGVAAANSLGNVLYGEYRWAFRVVALAFLALALVLYFRKRGICSVDEAKRQRTRVVNVASLVVFTSAGIYILWTYVVLHYWGIAAGLPWSQYTDEKWAIPASAVILTLAVAATWWFVRRSRA